MQELTFHIQALDDFLRMCQQIKYDITFHKCVITFFRQIYSYHCTSHNWSPMKVSNHPKAVTNHRQTRQISISLIKISRHPDLSDDDEALFSQLF